MPTVRLSPTVKMIDNTEKTIDWIARACLRKSKRVARLIQTFLKAQFRTPKSGNWYLVPGTNRLYRASAPGEYPAIATGRLDRTLKISNPLDTSSGVARTKLGTEPPYSATLQGVAAGGPTRPLLREAAAECRPAIQTIMQDPGDFR